MNPQAKDTEISASAPHYPVKPSIKVWAGVGFVVAGLMLAGAAKLHHGAQPSAPAPALASVSVSTPLQRDLDTGEGRVVIEAGGTKRLG